MLRTAGQAFLSTLRHVAEHQLGREHPCWHVIDDALAGGEAATLQAALNRLEPDVLEQLLAATHKAMREDPALILEAWKVTAPKH